MFSGEESIRIRCGLTAEEVEEVVADALDRLGRVRFGKRASFEVSARRFDSALVATEVYGRLAEGRKDGEWRLTVNFVVRPTPLCWAILVVGAIFFLWGVLILLVPYSTKGDVERAVARALRDARDDVEDRDGALPSG
jgi:hypothetical protein